MNSQKMLNAVAVLYGIEPADRAAFAKLTHENFKVLFPHENVTAAEVDATLNAIMKADERFSKYAV